MNKNTGLHIIIFLMGLLWFPNANGSTPPRFLELQYRVQDSLQIDLSHVTPRKFEHVNDLYTGEDFIYERTVDNSGWWIRFKQWLSDLFQDLFNLKNKGQAADATDIAIKIAGVIIFLLVAYFIFKAVMNDEGSWVFGKASDKSIIPVTDVENNLHSTDFQTLIQTAEAQNNYRLAIRYYYLWLIKQLTEAGVIAYDVEKTNSDYFNEMTSTPIKEGFAYTSYLYNYIWYGEFNVDEKQFGKAKHAFVKFLNTVKA